MTCEVSNLDDLLSFKVDSIMIYDFFEKEIKSLDSVYVSKQGILIIFSKWRPRDSI